MPALRWPPSSQALGGRVNCTARRGVRFGDVLEARLGQSRPVQGWQAAGEDQGAEHILLLGHLDTVWPLGTLKTIACGWRRPVVGSRRSGYEGRRGHGLYRH